jgi:DNA invertase Pin-like site-specific DNA recombinase
MQPKGDINGAIAEVERLKANGEPCDYQAIAIAFGCERSTLSRRCRGVNRSHEEYISE